MTDADVLERLLADRWSCRGFLDREVDRSVTERLLAMAGGRLRGATPSPGRSS